MKIIRNTKPISDLYNGMKSGDITVNKEYQRSPGLWPNNSRSYFIDTILNDYPFPKVVLWQKVDLKTKKTRVEIIDGQQRLSTIRDFVDNKIKLSSVSKKFAGKTFVDLDEEDQQSFLAYEVSLDSILSGTKEEILEIFKRINSYTLALNKSEQRFATYQGEFKWFISDLTDIISPFLSKYKILSDRDISRMQDDDLLVECCLQYLEGIAARNNKKLDEIYKKYNSSFPIKDELKEVILTSFEFLKNNFNQIFEECEIKSYNFYSLLGALIFNKYGFKNLNREICQFEPQNQFCINIDKSQECLIRIFSAIESKDYDNEYDDMINASSATTQSVKNRITRFSFLIRALQQS